MSRSEVDGHPQCWQLFVRKALGTAVVGLASGLHAAGLFLPVDSVDAASGGVAAAKSVSERHDGAAAPAAWERRVRIAHRELTVARDAIEGAGVGRLQLDVKDGLRLDVVVERTAPTKWGYSLSGRVAGGSVGFVTLVVHEEAVAGTVWTPDSAYELKHMGGGVHALQDVTNTPTLRCAAEPSGFTSAAAPAQSGVDDGSVVDILVVWLPDYEEKFTSGEPDVLLNVDMQIAYTNDAFERSGALVRLNLVGARKVVDPGPTHIPYILQLVRPNDGHMDRVHEWRDALGADLVFLLGPPGRPLVDCPFGIAGEYPSVFAHEIGHCLGVAHERSEAGLGFTYNYGFPTIGFHDTNRDARACDHTIMSYDIECGGFVPFYASPWRYHPEDGHPLGVTRFSRVRGVRGPADAVLAINRNRHRVANLRTSRSGSGR